MILRVPNNGHRLDRPSNKIQYSSYILTGDSAPSSVLQLYRPMPFVIRPLGLDLSLVHLKDVTMVLDPDSDALAFYVKLFYFRYVSSSPNP